MDTKKRFLMAINHEEPDQVPLFDLSIDSVPILNKYKGKTVGSQINLLRLLRFIIGWRKIAAWIASRKFAIRLVANAAVQLFKNIGYDACTVPVSFFLTKTTFPSPNQFVDEFGRQFIHSKLESGGMLVDTGFYQRGYFDTVDPQAAYEKWYDSPLDPDHPQRAEAYHTGLKCANGQIFVIPLMAGVFDVTWQAFGFPTFSKLLYTDPNFIERVFRDRGDFAVGLVENMLNLGAEAICVGDDLAYKSGPMFKPELYEKLVMSHMKRISSLIHSHNAKLIFHSDGNLTQLLDLLIEAGIDALHPLEPGAGMDIAQLKQTYGQKITLIGNVDPISILTHGTPEIIDAHVKWLINECAPGGGYILSSGHSVTYSVSVENFDAMISAARKYGKYPIRIDD